MSHSEMAWTRTSRKHNLGNGLPAHDPVLGPKMVRVWPPVRVLVDVQSAGNEITSLSPVLTIIELWLQN